MMWERYDEVKKAIGKQQKKFGKDPGMYKGKLLLALEATRQFKKGLSAMPKKQSKKKTRKKGEVLSKMVAPPRPTVSHRDSDVPADVLAILQEVENQKFERKQGEVVEQLDVIHGRVKKALQEGGLAASLIPTESELEFQRERATPQFDVKKKRQQLLHQRHLLEVIEDFSANSEVQKHLLREINKWFDFTQSDLDWELHSEHEFTGKDLANSAKAVNEAFKYSKRMCDKLRALGQKLMREAGLMDSDDEGKKESPKSKSVKKIDVNAKSNEVFNESSLLTNQSNFDNAMLLVKEILEQTLRMVRSNREKTLLRGAVKQQRFLMKATQSRQQETEKKDEELLDLNMKLNQQSDNKEQLEEENKQLMAKLEINDAQILKLNSGMHELESKNQKLRQNIANLEEQVEELAEELTRTPSVVTLSRQSLKKVSSKSVRIQSSGNLQIRQDLENLREQLEDETRRCGQLEALLKEEQELSAKLEAQIEMAEVKAKEDNSFSSRMKDELQMKMKSLNADKESLERQLARLRSELNCKNELIAFQDRRLMELKQEMDSFNVDDIIAEKIIRKGDTTISPEAKRVIVRIKHNMQMEINRLKDFLESEKQRGDADVRRLDQIHKDQLAGVHRQSIHLLRAINRFKGSIIHILERENLPGAAADVRRVPDLPTDEGPQDTRLLLAHMAGNAVELMVSMEFKLSQALMNKRLEVKDNAIARSFAARDLETQMEAAFKARQQADVLTEKLRETKEKLDASEEALKTVHQTEGEKFKGLADRYKQLWSNYTSLQKEISILHNDFEDSMKNKDKNVKVLLGNKRDLMKMLDERQAALDMMIEQAKQRKSEKESQFQLSVANLDRNLRVLTTLYERNQISQDMYKLTMSLLQHLDDLPDMRLQQLFTRYIVFKRLQRVKAHIQQALRDRNMMTDKEALKKYLMKTEKTMEQKTSAWQMQRGKLETDKKQIFKHMSNIFTDVVQENTILLLAGTTLVKPGQSGDEHRGTSPGSTDGGQCTPASGMHQQEVPSALVGHHMPIIGEQEKLWRLPSIPANVSVTTPRLLDLDINQRQLAARRALQRAFNRTAYEMPQVEGFDYQESVLRPLRELVSTNSQHLYLDVPHQRPSTPTKLLRKKSSALQYIIN